MARPPKTDGLAYFPHDSDARHDYKLGALRHRFGAKGYAFYFILLEIVYQSPRAEVNAASQDVIPFLAHEIGVTIDEFNEMLLYALNLELFSRNEWETEKNITSIGIKRRFNAYAKRRVAQQK